MDRDNYLSERLQNQIDWYSRKAGSNKKAFLRISVSIALLSLSIPLCVIFLLTQDNTMIHSSWLAYFGIAGLMIAVLSVLNHIYNYQDRWSHYRTVGESLKKERNLYQMGTGPYSGHEEPFDLLVERVEKLVSPRNS
ncbi:MAG: DUF4231 domain-containing protein [Bacteroidetes bacterium]|jgi:hypothetical protein|nr:DUF4231 domain-containing protein [Bacteroidota bacterium]